ncbi:hypothetical protein CMV30_02710 [Nibricoccus aquaticus]|uniref:TonB-dependent receptor plug domain-containing protein n=1 Tax=Nibricoccus aquaticus TaxID=2576891 RepID=A0A290QF33_9BACT|nr:TonB-dependent receptor plug domain-containing protein [Nibricoccus aquaticus]ATC62961.1 hypothetical protein CMV30_02710 [Nibricoccus aquaticus]
MKRPVARAGALSVTSALCLAFSPYLAAQTAPAAPAASTDTPAVEEETIILSPFTVEAAEDKDSYKASSTLAGTRVRTDLRDIASSISVVTSKFLQDTGATNQQSLLVFTTNTEVGGIQGNFGGLGGGNGLKENSALLKPNQNTRVRGLDSADNTRDYFQTDIPWDSYIVDRVDMQRGPNSILFGVGSPAGIVNTQTITPNMRKNEGKVENRIGSFGSVRYSLDVGHVLVKDQLAIRVAALDDDTKYRQDPAYNHDRRIFGVVRFDPKLFGDSAHTSIKANFEKGKVDANRPRTMAPIDQITPYFATSSSNPLDPTQPAINRQAYDAWQFQSTALTNGANGNANMGWIGGAAVWNPWMNATMARLGSADPVFWYNANSGAPFLVQQSNMSTRWALSNTGSIDGGIDGFPFAHQVSINGYNTYTKNAEIRANALGLTNPYPGAQKNYYKDKSLTDTSIFDFYNYLIDGPNKYEKEGWTSYNLDVSQTFFNGRLGFQAVWDKQSYDSKQAMNLSDTPFISIDNNLNLIDGPAAYGMSIPNPNVGRAYVGSSGHYGNNESFSERENFRLTGFAEVRASDYMEKSWLSDLLGRHVFNVVGSRDTKNAESRNFLRYATDANWALMNNETANISQGFRQVDWISYLSDNLSGRSSAAGAGISNINARQSPSGQTIVKYYDSHWKRPTNPADPGYVNPATPWRNPFYTNLANPPESYESENPANYVGWTNTAVNILNADNGDINQLYTDGTKLKTVIDSKGFTWQGYLWDGMVVPTYGYRTDKVKSYSANAPANSVTGVASMNYEILTAPSDVSEGTSRSWGVVVHTPKFIKKNLPWDSDISLTYNKSENFRAENRVDYQGNRIDNARGETEEYGVVLSTLDNRVSLKVVKYETTVKDANLSGDPQVSTLGSNTYWLYLAEAWGAASATANMIGLTGNDTSGGAWYWDWANQPVSNGGANTAYGAMPRDPAGASIDAAEIAASLAWINSMQPQSFYDAYGINVNVANLKSSAASGNWSAPYSSYIGGGWSPSSGPGGVQAAGAGKIRGMYPVGTIDNVSEGYELELTARPTNNWNVTFNASKTTASRTNLSKALSTFIESTHQRLAGPAGDLRTWWAGDTTGTFRNNYNNNVYAAYIFQLEQDGQSASEVRPWAFNVVTNYNFSRSFLKGVNVGGGYRWQDGAILGYRLTKAPTPTDPNNVKLDVNQPIYGDSEAHADLWIGYERQLSPKIKWRIQGNIRNVGEDVGLTPISVQPDGSPAAQRIQEGMTWQITNTFSF